jgi:transcription antitermination factor NusG
VNWYVLYTKSRYERAAAGKLVASGIEVYCPVLKLKRKWSDRWKWVEEPLFRSYIFIRLNDEEREQVLRIPGIVRYIYHCGKPAIVRSSEIEQLKNWLNEYSHESFECSAFQAQDIVRLRSGALMNYKAEVVSNSGRFLCLFLESLGVRIKVDLSKNIVEKIASV